MNDDSWHITYADITEAPVFTESPPRPGLYYDFDFDTHTWIISAERLTQAKADKNAALMSKLVRVKQIEIWIDRNSKKKLDYLNNGASRVFANILLQQRMARKFR